MISVRTEHARHIVVLGAIAVGLLLMLVVPAMASAQTAAAPAAPALEETPLDPAGAGDPAAVDEPAPAEEAAPPAAEEPVAEEPLPPPATTEPEATPAPAPEGDAQPTSPVVSETPAAPAAPAEAMPDAGATLVLPDAPGIPAALKVVAGPPRADPPPAAPQLAPTSIVSPVEPLAAPPDIPAAPAATTRPEPAAAALRAPLRTDLIDALGGVEARTPGPLAVARGAAPGPAGAEAADADGNPFATLAAHGGPAPAGSSLLAVLASYVIPGSGLPSTTLLLFVQLAVILAAFYAPRSGIGERLVALGPLGPRHGYRTVLARPG